MINFEKNHCNKLKILNNRENARRKRTGIGSVKLIRQALCMQAEYMANKLGVKNGRIYQLEKAEMDGSITLGALRKVAEALECELIYTFIPKNELARRKIK